MDVLTFIQGIPKFSAMNHSEKIKAFAWYLHSHRAQKTFTAKEIHDCFDATNVEKPSNIGPFLTSLERRKPKIVLKTGNSWRLEHTARKTLDLQLGQRQISVHVSALLDGVANSISDAAEKEFFAETDTCYRNGAFRASVVMMWNLAYFHLCTYLLRHSLAKFNTTYQTKLAAKWAKAKTVPIAKYDDFSADLKESEVLEIAKWGGLITNDLYKVLDHALDRRNSAAHPSSVSVSQLKAESHIHDLVVDVMQKLQL